MSNIGISDEVVPSDPLAREQNPYYQIFTRKGTHARLIHRALEASNKQGRLPVFSLDLPEYDNNSNPGAKCFVTAGYEAFWREYTHTPPHDRCFYEIVLHDQPCHLYVDVDMDRTLNPEVDTERERWMQTEFLAECRTCILELGMVSSTNDIRVVTLDSSKDGKLSKHFIIKLSKACFTNNYHCGAFVRRIRNRLLRKHGMPIEKNPFFVWKREKDRKNPGNTVQVLDFYADLAVYTQRRNWRLYGSTKRSGAYRPLFVEGEKNPLGTSLDKKTFMDCLVQRIDPKETAPMDCLEENGSTPWSTNDKNIMRPDMPPSTRVPVKRTASNRNVETPDLTTKTYYEHTYPFTTIFSLFGEQGREFAFEDASHRMRRYIFFDTVEDFRKEVLTRLPSAIHIGPVYVGHGEHRTVKYRELVFDIDLNDYGNARGCCKDEKKACCKCWKYAQFCIRVLHRFLSDYGFQKILFFFSGLKGLHCWVFDEKARTMSKQARETLVRDLQIPELDFGRSDGVCKPPKRRRYIGDLLKEKNDQYYEKMITEEQGLKREFETKRTQWGLESALLYFLWPRIDAKVTSEPTHMIKSPFAKNPKSGRSCWMLNQNASENPLLSSLSEKSLQENLSMFSKASADIKRRVS